MFFCIDNVWTRFVPSLKGEWAWAQKAQNNEFVENELENWARMSWTTNQLDSNDRNGKTDGV